MNLRLLLCIGMGVFVIHIGVVMILSHLRPQPRFIPTPKPNFTAKARTVVDPGTGEKTTYREITVSTRFISPAPSAPPVPSLVNPAR